MWRPLAVSLDLLLAWYLRRFLFGERAHLTDPAELARALDEIEQQPGGLLKPPDPMAPGEAALARGDSVWGADLHLFKMPSVLPWGPEANRTVWGQAIVPRGRGLAGPMVLRVHPWIGPTGLGWLRRGGKGLLRAGAGVVSIDLPHHARRTGEGLWPGELVFSGDIAQTVRSAAQGLADLRRALAWLRAQGCGPIGCMGYSMGGWGAALLAASEPDLACVAAGVPPVEVVETLRTSCLTRGPIRRDFEASHVSEEMLARAERLLSPRSYPALVPRERLLVAAALHDAVIPPASVERLAGHWDCEVWRARQSHMGLFLSRGFQRRLAGWMLARMR